MSHYPLQHGASGDSLQTSEMSECHNDDENSRTITNSPIASVQQCLRSPRMPHNRVCVCVCVWALSRCRCQHLAVVTSHALHHCPHVSADHVGDCGVVFVFQSPFYFHVTSFVTCNFIKSSCHSCSTNHL